MKYRPKIGPGDFDTKTRQVAQVPRARATRSRSRSCSGAARSTIPSSGKRILDRVAEHVDGTAGSRPMPRLDGRNMVMVLAPGQAGPGSPRRRGTRQNGNGSELQAPAEPTPTAASRGRRCAGRQPAPSAAGDRPPAPAAVEPEPAAERR